MRLSATLGAVALALSFTGAGMAGTPYTPPEIAQGENGWESYIDPMMLDASSVSGLTPDPTSPEAVVVLYLASRIRGDRAWKGAVVSDPDRKAKKALKAWKSWDLKAAQIQSRKMRGADRGYVRVWFDVTIDGDADSGSDDFTVIRVGDEWRIAEIPS